MTEIAKYIAVIMASTLKFLGGTFTGFAMKLHWIETVLCSTAGMMVTIILTNYVGTWISQLIQKFRKGKPKRFTRLNRLAVTIWNKFGVKGLAFLTPALFTPPLGGFLMVAFRVPRTQAFFWMLVSGLFWGVVFTLLVYKLTFLQELFSR